jgi:ethanolamine ammonia-lyase small subunit
MSDSWIALRRFTTARIALGRSGHALPTRAQLEFQLAHAQARDAVHLPWDIDRCAERIRAWNGIDCLIVETQATDREKYLRYPNLGRTLSDESRARLRRLESTDVAIVMSNGLSSTAVEQHGLPLLEAMIKKYRACQLRIAPVCLARNGRVALSDDIGSTLSAQVAVMIVGERPGLSAVDSLGIYLTYRPRIGNTDAQRNCISNIRPPEGTGYDEAAIKLVYLTLEAIRLRLSGVNLKDEMSAADQARLLARHGDQRRS